MGQGWSGDSTGDIPHLRDDDPAVARLTRNTKVMFFFHRYASGRDTMGRRQGPLRSAPLCLCFLGYWVFDVEEERTFQPL